MMNSRLVCRSLTSLRLRSPSSTYTILPKRSRNLTRLENRNFTVISNNRHNRNSAQNFSLLYRTHDKQFSNFAKSEYIHPLSQIVLEHLQSTHSEWIQRMGLEKGLEVKKDGTFVLRFCNDDGGGSEEVESIWTMYEPTEKKHYLCITKNNLVGRYLLQDNTKPAWHTDRRSVPERVQDAVDEMVMKVDEMVKK